MDPIIIDTTVVQPIYDWLAKPIGTSNLTWGIFVAILVGLYIVREELL